MGLLLGMWNETNKELTIRRPNGQVFRVKGTDVTGGGNTVFGVETVGSEIHVLTGSKSNPQPNRRVRFSDCGMRKGDSGV